MTRAKGPTHVVPKNGKGGVSFGALNTGWGRGFTMGRRGERWGLTTVLRQRANTAVKIGKTGL